MTDCIICGAGLLGMLTARELATAGLEVTIIDRQRAGQESSWAGGGILSPLFPWLFPEAVTRLAQWSQARYQHLAAELLEETGVDTEWQRDGLLVVDYENQGKIVDWANQHGYEANVLSKSKLDEIEPALAEKFQRALLFPQIAQIRNPRLVKAMRASLLKKGVKLLEDTEIESVKVQKGKATGVIANGSEITSHNIIITGGAWSNSLLQPLGCEIKVNPVRGQMLSFKTSPGTVRHVILGKDHYIIPRRDGLVLAGSTLENAGFLKTPTKMAFEKLYRRAIGIVPALSEFPLEAQWSGLRPGNTRNGVPYISAVSEVPGVYVNTGHFRNGVVLGYSSATLMADLLLKREPILDPLPYCF